MESSNAFENGFRNGLIAASVLIKNRAEYLRGTTICGSIANYTKHEKAIQELERMVREIPKITTPIILR